MITGPNKSKTLTKHTSCECKCRFDGKNLIQINGGITINVDVCYYFDYRELLILILQIFC